MVLTNRIRRIHFVGIGGAGISAEAFLMSDMGYEVSGSDLQLSSTTDALQMRGVDIHQGHSSAYVKNAHLVVYSTAIPSDNIELRTALEIGVPVLDRISFLSYLMNNKFGITVSGSHGKTSTSSMIATIFYLADKDPSVAVGGFVDKLFGNARLGQSKYFICEGDESNNSFLKLSTTVCVVTNIDDDHVYYHKSMDNLKRSFLQFINQIEPDGLAVVCTDDANVLELIPRIKTRCLTYGVNADATFTAKNIRLEKMESWFDVHDKTRGKLGSIHLSIPGLYNVQNALAAIAVADFCGVDFGIAAYALENFPGVHRRFEKLAEVDGITIVDDYAHHPTEISSLLSATRNGSARRIRVIFQPHRFTRSKQLAERFPDAFRNADEIVLTEIYSAGEAPIEGIGSQYLFSFFRQSYPAESIRCLPKKEEVLDYFKKTMKTGDFIMTVGAGDVYRVGLELAEFLRLTRGPKNGDGKLF